MGGNKGTYIKNGSHRLPFFFFVYKTPFYKKYTYICEKIILIRYTYIIYYAEENH